METLFGRFPHLAEDIYGLLNGKTLSCCGQINNQWKESLKEYRFHLVKKIRKLLKNQNIMYGPVEDSDKEEHQTSYKNPIETLSIFTWSTGIKEHPVALERNITVEQLPRSDLIKILNYFCDYDGVFFLSLSNSYFLQSESEPEPDQEPELGSKFKLQWKGHHQVFFEAAIDPKQHMDATLSCEDYKFHVHKQVLSVCSLYFG